MDLKSLFKTHRFLKLKVSNWVSCHPNERERFWRRPIKFTVNVLPILVPSSSSKWVSVMSERLYFRLNISWNPARSSPNDLSTFSNFTVRSMDFFVPLKCHVAKIGLSPDADAILLLLEGSGINFRNDQPSRRLRWLQLSKVYQEKVQFSKVFGKKSCCWVRN